MPARNANRRPRRGRFSSAARAKSWDNHVSHLEELADTPGFRALRETIVKRARLGPNDRVLDIGAGTGLLTLAAAAKAAHVTAVDISRAMSAHLEDKLVRRSIDNVDVHTGTASKLPVADQSIDVILSNYCLLVRAPGCQAPFVVKSAAGVGKGWGCVGALDRADRLRAGAQPYFGPRPSGWLRGRRQDV